MSERAKQNVLSVFATGVGVALLVYCRHDALVNGEYSLKLVVLGAAMLAWGPVSFALNLRDPTTTRRGIERLTGTSSGTKRRLGGPLAVAVLLLVAVAGIDYLFTAWVDRDIQACRAQGTCAGSTGPRSIP